MLKLGLWELNLEFVSAELTSLGMTLSLYVGFTFPGVWEMCAQLRAASVTFASGSTVWRGLNIYCTPTTSTATSRLIDLMTTGMVGLIYIFFVNFLLVV